MLWEGRFGARRGAVNSAAAAPRGGVKMERGGPSAPSRAFRPRSLSLLCPFSFHDERERFPANYSARVRDGRQEEAKRLISNFAFVTLVGQATTKVT